MIPCLGEKKELYGWAETQKLPWSGACCFVILGKSLTFVFDIKKYWINKVACLAQGMIHNVNPVPTFLMQVLNFIKV